MITLETERLIMRPFAETDLDAYAEMCADPEVMHFLGGKTFTRMESWRHIAAQLGHWQLRSYGQWAVVRRDTGEFIGRVGFLNPEGWPGFELGWTLVRSAWGHGFATEAARRALDFAFVAAIAALLSGGAGRSGARTSSSPSRYTVVLQPWLSSVFH